MLLDSKGGGQANPLGRKPIDMSTTTPLICTECGNDMFMPVMKFRKISAIASPSGKEGIIPVEVYTCTACGAIPADLDFKI